MPVTARAQKVMAPTAAPAEAAAEEEPIQSGEREEAMRAKMAAPKALEGMSKIAQTQREVSAAPKLEGRGHSVRIVSGIRSGEAKTAARRSLKGTEALDG